MPLDRRTFLATSATLAVTVTGGCTGCVPSPTGTLRMTPADDTDIAREALTFFDTSRVDDPEAEGPVALAGRVVDEGTVTTEDTDEPLPTNRPVVVDDDVYRFDAEVVDSREMRAFPVTINPIRVDDGEETPGPSDRIAYADLPAVDRAQFERLGYDDERPIGIGTRFTYRPEDVAESVLVPVPEYTAIVWPNGPATVEVDGDYTFEVYTYELTRERVTSAAAFGADVRERFGFDLSGLDDEERDIVAAAVDPETPASDGEDGRSSYVVAHDEEPSPAFRSLVDRFRAHDLVVFEWDHDDGDDESWYVSGEYVVRYEGSVYWTRLFVREARFTGTPT